MDTSGQGRDLLGDTFETDDIPLADEAETELTLQEEAFTEKPGEQEEPMSPSSVPERTLMLYNRSSVLMRS